MNRPSLDPADRLWPGPEANIDREVERILSRRGEDPVARPVTAAELEAMLPQQPPEGGLELEKVLAEVHRAVVPFTRRNGHPGMFGYVCGSGLPTDPLAHALVAAMGQNVTGFPSAPGATILERRLIRWLAEIAGMPDGAEGLLFGGGSQANYSALAMALHHRRDRHAGLHAEPARRVYASAAVHFSVRRAVRLLGLGSAGLMEVAEDDRGRLDPAALTAAIAADRRAGIEPIAVVATAGTTGFGAIDPLPEIAEICREQSLWMHVDAAYGGAVMVSKRLATRLRGIELADSITLDLHKWLYTGFDCSALLLRDPQAAKRTFFEAADYVGIPAEAPPEQHAFFHLGPETSRRFRALAPWIAIRHYGLHRLARSIEHNVDCAAYLGRSVAECPGLELVREPELSIVCFRFDESVVGADERIEEVRQRLMDDGRFYLSPMSLAGRSIFRVCIVGSETDADTIDDLLDEVLLDHPLRCR